MPLGFPLSTLPPLNHDDPAFIKLKSEIDMAMSECKNLKKELMSTKSKLKTAEIDKKSLQQQIASITPSTVANLPSIDSSGPCDQVVRQLKEDVKFRTSLLEASKSQIAMLEKDKAVLQAKLQQLQQLASSPNRKLGGPLVKAASRESGKASFSFISLSKEDERKVFYIIIGVMALLSLLGLLTRTPMCPCDAL